jgi:hypothetical protein
MAYILPPPPVNDQPGSFTWLEWYRQLRSYVSSTGSVPWYIIDFAGSNITDIIGRNHNQLQGLQGGGASERYHLTLAQYASLTSGAHNSLLGLQGGTTSEYYHTTAAQSTDLLTGAYGSMYIDNGSVVRTIAATNTYYEVASGFTGGRCSQFVFQNSKELKCSRAGTYKISWQMSRSVPGTLQEIEGGVFKNSTIQLNTTSHNQSVAAATQQSFSGNGIIALAVNDLISLAVNNNTSTNSITITHANITITRVGS